MSEQRIVIIASGDFKKPEFYRELLRPDDYIITCNGGSIHALTIGVKPNLIIGDFDSLLPEKREEIESTNPELIKHPDEKDKSDLELALEHAVEMNPSEIIILGALGGDRTDHGFINLLLLKIPLNKGIPALIIDERQEIRMTDGDLEIEGLPGEYLSLFALTGQVDNIRTEGLKFPLQNEPLNFGSTRGLSNEFTSGKAMISFSAGLLLLIKTISPVK